ncbi:MAG: nucleotide-binding protein, partial [Candidatus Bathyarchaeota archaeon]|nr:nucleotide-binding protein [Candidatus Bathyarchaeota archaeon]
EFITSAPEDKKEETRTPTIKIAKKRKVFIIHGRDETQALRLQKYLSKTLNLEAEMFEDFKERSGSKTIIEQLEYIQNNVGYAFVIVTPDDLGCLRKDIDKCRTKFMIGKEKIKIDTVCKILDKLNSRARQNVVFEHGLFIGALGRDYVCCLLKEETKEKPSDIDGILYEGFKESVKEKFTEITKKLKNVDLVKT